MSVPNASPEAVRLDEAFAQAMAAPPKPKDPPPPPVIDQDAPHGRDDEGKPLAPYGFTVDGRVKKDNRGKKPSKDAAPRIIKPTGQAVEKPGKGSGKEPVVLPPKDYLEPLTAAADSMWMVLSSASKLPILPSAIRTKVGAEAAIFHANSGQLAQAVNTAAQHNPRARALAEKFAKGDVSWTLTVASMTLPFLMQTALLFKPGDKPEGFPTAGQLAAKNDQDLQDYVEGLALAQQEQEQKAA